MSRQRRWFARLTARFKRFQRGVGAIVALSQAVYRASGDTKLDSRLEPALAGYPEVLQYSCLMAVPARLCGSPAAVGCHDALAASQGAQPASLYSSCVLRAP